MGLIKEEYKDTTTGLTLKPAYAKIVRLYIEEENKAKAYFGISETRDLIETHGPINEIMFECEIDKKTDNVYTEIYSKAKEDIFAEWKDNII